MPSFRDLEVYQEAYRLALEVHRLTLGFPDIERYVLAEQTRRASVLSSLISHLSLPEW
jgi:four helix bundle protein